jgi:large subunit ribosomal protein L4
MSKLPVKNGQGETVGEYDLPDGLLIYDKGEQAVHEAVLAYQANHRAGTACTKTKTEVSGTGAKPWRQKGTGRARSGYKQSPVWRGGSVAMGPRLRSFERRLPRKVARLAFQRAFSEKVSAGRVVVFDGLDCAAPKTKTVAGFLKAQGADRGAVLVLASVEQPLRLSARNIPGVEITTAQILNVYEVLRYPLVLVSREGMDQLVERLQAASKGKR